MKNILNPFVLYVFFMYICGMDFYYELRFGISTKITKEVQKFFQEWGTPKIILNKPIGSVVGLNPMPEDSFGKTFSPLLLKSNELIKLLEAIEGKDFYFYRNIDGRNHKIKMKTK
jgi:hypothetical protein